MLSNHVFVCVDSLFDVGCAWLRIGGLRYHLLQCCDNVDPAVKKNFKYLQLTERIASLELDIEVLFIVFYFDSSPFCSLNVF